MDFVLFGLLFTAVFFVGAVLYKRTEDITDVIFGEFGSAFQQFDSELIKTRETLERQLGEIDASIERLVAFKQQRIK